jgi:hypothetical protein
MARGPQLGQLAVDPRPARRPLLTYARWLALGAFAGGMVGVATSYLAYTGRQNAAAALGIASGMVGAVVGAVQVLAIAEAEQSMLEQPVAEDSVIVTLDDPTTGATGLWW